MQRFYSLLALVFLLFSHPILAAEDPGAIELSSFENFELLDLKADYDPDDDEYVLISSDCQDLQNVDLNTVNQEIIADTKFMSSIFKPRFAFSILSGIGSLYLSKFYDKDTFALVAKIAFSQAGVPRVLSSVLVSVATMSKDEDIVSKIIQMQEKNYVWFVLFKKSPVFPYLQRSLSQQFKTQVCQRLPMAKQVSSLWNWFQ